MVVWSGYIYPRIRSDGREKKVWKDVKGGSGTIAWPYMDSSKQLRKYFPHKCFFNMAPRQDGSEQDKGGGRGFDGKRGILPSSSALGLPRLKL